MATWFVQLRDRALLSSPPKPIVARREKGQAWVRVVVTLAVVGAVYLARSPTPFLVAVPFALLLYLMLSTVFAVAIRSATHSPWWRRAVFNAADVAVISYVMIEAGEAGLLLFALLLWVTLGNGFRFGTASLVVSAMLSALGFGVVALLSPV